MTLPKDGIRQMLSILDTIALTGTSETLAALLHEIEDSLEKAEKLAAKEG